MLNGWMAGFVYIWPPRYEEVIRHSTLRSEHIAIILLSLGSGFLARLQTDSLANSQIKSRGMLETGPMICLRTSNIAREKALVLFIAYLILRPHPLAFGVA
jgi:hypothetical protein